MSTYDLRDDILALPVFDTHTHLNIPGVPIPARDVWDIVHYFWFYRELVAAGYPDNAKTMDPDDRIAAFVDAFAKTRHTTMNWVVRHIFRDLYDLDLHDADSIKAADKAVQTSFNKDDWPRQVTDKIHVKRIAVNHVDHADFPGLPGVGCALPVNAGLDRGKLTTLLTAQHAPDASAAVAESVNQKLDALADQGIRGIRLDVSAFAGEPQLVEREDRQGRPLTERQAHKLLIQTILNGLARRDMFAQLFLGVGKDDAGVAGPINNPRLIVDLHPLFNACECDFELVIGAELSNLDAIQAARMFPNVHVGGMWWYNFRQSTYCQSMAYRIEAIPALKSCIVASDARCIEWCYGKILFIKTILAEFLEERIEKGWIDRDGALDVAREWLHDAAARRYATAEHGPV